MTIFNAVQQCNQDYSATCEPGDTEMAFPSDLRAMAVRPAEQMSSLEDVDEPPKNFEVDEPIEDAPDEGSSVPAVLPTTHAAPAFTTNPASTGAPTSSPRVPANSSPNATSTTSSPRVPACWYRGGDSRGVFFSEQGLSDALHAGHPDFVDDGTTSVLSSGVTTVSTASPIPVSHQNKSILNPFFLKLLKKESGGAGAWPKGVIVGYPTAGHYRHQLGPAAEDLVHARIESLEDGGGGRGGPRHNPVLRFAVDTTFITPKVVKKNDKNRTQLSWSGGDANLSASVGPFVVNSLLEERDRERLREELSKIMGAASVDNVKGVLPAEVQIYPAIVPSGAGTAPAGTGSSSRPTLTARFFVRRSDFTTQNLVDAMTAENNVEDVKAVELQYRHPVTPSLGRTAPTTAPVMVTGAVVGASPSASPRPPSMQESMLPTGAAKDVVNVVEGISLPVMVRNLVNLVEGISLPVMVVVGRGQAGTSSEQIINQVSRDSSTVTRRPLTIYSQ